MDDEGKQALFNAGLFQPRRLDRLQSILNSVRFSPLMYNDIFQCYNYEVIFNCLTSMFFEGEQKFSDKEKFKGNAMRTAIRDFMKNYPVHELRKRVTDGEKEIIINNNNWTILNKHLEAYETEIRGMIDSHGLNSPENEDDGLF